MGLRAVKLMALSFSLVSADHKGACSGFDFDQLWSRSLACAVAARTIARRSKICPAEEAFVAGLLRDIGQLVLATGTGGAVQQSHPRSRRDRRLAGQRSSSG